MASAACRSPRAVGENARSNEQLAFAAKLPVQVLLLIGKSAELKLADEPGTATSAMETLLAAEPKLMVNGAAWLIVPGLWLQKVMAGPSGHPGAAFDRSALKLKLNPSVSAAGLNLC